jgi:hypothetical protein
MAPAEFRRRLYRRGSSFETTVPIPLLFALDRKKKYNVVFAFEPEANKWFVKFEERREKRLDEKI